MNHIFNPLSVGGEFRKPFQTFMSNLDPDKASLNEAPNMRSNIFVTRILKLQKVMIETIVLCFPILKNLSNRNKSTNSVTVLVIIKLT